MTKLHVAFTIPTPETLEVIRYVRANPRLWNHLRQYLYAASDLRRYVEGAMSVGDSDVKPFVKLAFDHVDWDVVRESIRLTDEDIEALLSS